MSEEAEQEAAKKEQDAAKQETIRKEQEAAKKDQELRLHVLQSKIEEEKRVQAKRLAFRTANDAEWARRKKLKDKRRRPK